MQDKAYFSLFDKRVPYSTQQLFKAFRVVFLLSTVVVVLLLQHFYSAGGIAGKYIARLPFLADLPKQFGYLIGWGFFTSAIFLIIPLIAIKLLREPVANYGLSLSKGGAYIYLLSPLLILPVIYVVSLDKEFQATYPFLDNPLSFQQLIYWELIYAMQFLALEFFFRGFVFKFILQYISLYPAMIVATIPYTYIHFVKPLPEAIASFFGGILLCWISHKYKSIVIGVYLHIVVAITMDMFVLHNEGWFAQMLQ